MQLMPFHRNPCKLQLFFSVGITDYELSRKTVFYNIASIVLVSHIYTNITAVIDALTVAQMTYCVKVPS